MIFSGEDINENDTLYVYFVTRELSMSNLASYISLVLMGNTVVVRKEKSPLYVSSVPIESETCEDFCFIRVQSYV